MYGGPSPKYDMRILHAPPVKRLVNIYGINLDTEKFFFYKKRGDTFVLDTKASVTVEGYSIHEGIAFECANTPQHELKAAGLQNYRRSGWSIEFSGWCSRKTHFTPRRWNGPLRIFGVPKLSLDKAD